MLTMRTTDIQLRTLKQMLMTMARNSRRPGVMEDTEDRTGEGAVFHC